MGLTNWLGFSDPEDVSVIDAAGVKLQVDLYPTRPWLFRRWAVRVIDPVHSRLVEATASGDGERHYVAQVSGKDADRVEVLPVERKPSERILRCWTLAGAAQRQQREARRIEREIERLTARADSGA